MVHDPLAPASPGSAGAAPAHGDPHIQFEVFQPRLWGIPGHPSLQPAATLVFGLSRMPDFPTLLARLEWLRHAAPDTGEAYPSAGAMLCLHALPTARDDEAWNAAVLDEATELIAHGDRVRAGVFDLHLLHETDNTGRPAGRAALVLRADSSAAGGSRGIAAAALVLDSEPIVDTPPAVAKAQGPAAAATGRTLGDRGRTAMAPGIRAAQQSAGWARVAADAAADGAVAAIAALTHPRQTGLYQARRARAAWGLVTPNSSILSPACTGRSTAHRLLVNHSPAADAHAAASTIGGDLGTIALVAATGALGGYHLDQHTPAPMARVYTPVTPAYDPETQLCPPPASIRVRLPLAPNEPLPRGRAIVERLARISTSEDLPTATRLQSMAAADLPVHVLDPIGRNLLRGCDMTVVAVHGPAAPMYLAGAEVESILRFGSRYGAALGLTLVEYAGRVSWCWDLDPAAVRDLASMRYRIDRAIRAAMTIPDTVDSDGRIIRAGLSDVIDEDPTRHWAGL